MPRATVKRSVPESPNRTYTGMPSSSTPDMHTFIKPEVTPSPHLKDHEYVCATPPDQYILPNVNAVPNVKRKLYPESQPRPGRQPIPMKNEFKRPPVKKPKKTATSKLTPRCNQSLSLLTKKFTEIVQESADGVVNLNEASARLNVQKRRIYDITNVLEGCGIVQKKSKNQVQWKSSSQGSIRKSKLENEIRALDCESRRLDYLIGIGNASLTKLGPQMPNAFITYHDLRAIAKYKDKTLAVVKAPPDTKILVPDNDEYKLQLKSKTEEIEVFLCPDNVSPSKNKMASVPVPPVDPLLKDIQELSPGILKILQTPPVPLFDSPVTDHKPISAQTCRQITFSKDLSSDPILQTLTYRKDEAEEQQLKEELSEDCFIGGSSDNKDSLDPLAVASPFLKKTGSMGFGNSHFLAELDTKNTNYGALFGPTFENPQYNDATIKTEQKYYDYTDPMFCCGPFVSLEPPPHSQYNFSLDAEEGAVDLFHDAFGF